MRHSKKIVAMLLMAICFMGILPLSVSAESTEHLNPQPYLEVPYNLVSAGNLFDICKVTMDGNDEMILEYWNSGAYANSFSVNAISMSDYGQKNIQFMGEGIRKPITWLYFIAGPTNIDEATNVSYAIGYTADVLGTTNNFDYTFVLTVNVYNLNKLVGQYLYLARNVTMEMLLNPYPDYWINSGADVYLLYRYNNGRDTGVYQPIDVIFEREIYITRFTITVGVPTETGFPKMLSISTESIADIVIDKYTQLTNIIVSQIDNVWGGTSWLSIVPIIVFGGAITMSTIYIIKKLFEGRY